MLWAITKRKYKAALQRARDDGKISSRLPDAEAQTVLIYGAPEVFWRAGLLGSEAYSAGIHTRSDGTIYIGHTRPCHADIPRESFQPR